MLRQWCTITHQRTRICECKGKNVPIFLSNGLRITECGIMNDILYQVNSNWRTYRRQPQQIWLVPSTNATCFGRTGHLQAVNTRYLKRGNQQYPRKNWHGCILITLLPVPWRWKQKFLQKLWYQHTRDSIPRQVYKVVSQTHLFGTLGLCVKRKELLQVTSSK